MLCRPIQPIRRSASASIAGRLGMEAAADLRVGWIGLQSIAHHFGQRMFEGRAVAGQDNRRAARFVFELGSFYRLIIAGLLESLFDQRSERESIGREEGIARQETHLVNQAGHSLYPISQSGVERSAKFRIFPFVGQELLMSR